MTMMTMKTTVVVYIALLTRSQALSSPMAPRINVNSLVNTVSAVRVLHG